MFNKFADGVSVSQMVTDFGRTHQLSKSSHLHAQAEQENVATTRADVLLRVNLVLFRRDESSVRTCASPRKR